MELKNDDLLLQSLHKEAELISKEINRLYQKKAVIEKKINEVKAQRFLAANILPDAVWDLQVSKDGDSYLDFNYMKTHQRWYNKFDEAYRTNSNHYIIDLGDCIIRVNDSEITIEPNDNVSIKEIILKYDLTVLTESLDDNEKMLEKQLSEIKKIKAEIQ